MKHLLFVISFLLPPWLLCQELPFEFDNFYRFHHFKDYIVIQKDIYPERDPITDTVYSCNFNEHGWIMEEKFVAGHNEDYANHYFRNEDGEIDSVLQYYQVYRGSGKYDIGRVRMIKYLKGNSPNEILREVTYCHRLEDDKANAKRDSIVLDSIERNHGNVKRVPFPRFYYYSDDFECETSVLKKIKTVEDRKTVTSWYEGEDLNYRLSYEFDANEKLVSETKNYMEYVASGDSSIGALNNEIRTYIRRKNKVLIIDSNLFDLSHLIDPVLSKIDSVYQNKENEIRIKSEAKHFRISKKKKELVADDTYWFTYHYENGRLIFTESWDKSDFYNIKKRKDTEITYIYGEGLNFKLPGWMKYGRWWFRDSWE